MTRCIPGSWRRKGLLRRARAATISVRGIAALLIVVSCSTPALGWGDEGHRVIATIAQTFLDPATQAKVDAILASDPDTLTAPDMASRATWADKWRDSGHRETAAWHFIDIELAAPSLTQACFGQPTPATPASAGPAQDCVVDRVVAFAAELAATATFPAERLLALKYLLHFVGDLHQPLHASDNQDRGGNCVLVTLDSGLTVKLHAYWDTNLIVELGSDPTALAATLSSQITPKQQALWRAGSPADWAMEAFQLSRAVVYQVGSAPGCPTNPAAIALPAGYDAAAQTAASLQLQRAGVRLAAVLTEALSGTWGSVVQTPAAPQLATTTVHAFEQRPRSVQSRACSLQADNLGLHGGPHRRFRRRCMVQQAGSAATS